MRSSLCTQWRPARIGIRGNDGNDGNDGNARRLVIVVDGREALLGYPWGATATGHWSRNPGFVQVTEDYIRHDMWITEVMERSSGILTGFRGRGRREMQELLDSGLPGLFV